MPALAIHLLSKRPVLVVGTVAAALEVLAFLVVLSTASIGVGDAGAVLNLSQEKQVGRSYARGDKQHTSDELWVVHPTCELQRNQLVCICTRLRW
mgnify:CR=1 FL=1